MTQSMCWGWIDLHKLFTLNTCDTISELKLNSLHMNHLYYVTRSICWHWIHLHITVYTKHLWHDQCVEVEFTWQNCYTKHLWHDQCVEVEFTWHELVYTKHLWHNQCVEVEFTCTWTVYTKHLWQINVWRLRTFYTKHLTQSMCWGWIDLNKLFTLNTCDTISELKLNSLTWTIYTKHLWHDQCVRLNSLAQTVYTKHLWHDQCVEVEFTWQNCLH